MDLQPLSPVDIGLGPLRVLIQDAGHTHVENVEDLDILTCYIHEESLHIWFLMAWIYIDIDEYIF